VLSNKTASKEPDAHPVIDSPEIPQRRLLLAQYSSERTDGQFVMKQYDATYCAFTRLFLSITWLPRCLICLKPRLSSAWITSAPESLGKLGIRGLKSGQERTPNFGQWKLLKVEFRGLFEISDSLLNRVALAHSAYFRAFATKRLSSRWLTAEKVCRVIALPPTNSMIHSLAMIGNP
jgi:hypothetical protein